MRELPPIQRSILFSDGITVMPITCFNFLEQICSLLDDQWLMTQENCLFSFKDPCAIQIEKDVRGDLNQSWFWYETQKAQCTSCGDFFAPIVVFIDSTPEDKYEKVNVKPIMFTEGWFKHNIHTKGQSWRPLGFVSDMKVKSSAQNATGTFAAKDYHTVLKVILQEIAAVHSAGGFDHTLSLSLSQWKYFLM